MDEGKIVQTTMSLLIDDVRKIVKNGLYKAYQDVNITTVYTYWQVGRRIVEEEQQDEWEEYFNQYRQACQELSN